MGNLMGIKCVLLIVSRFLTESTLLNVCSYSFYNKATCVRNAMIKLKSNESFFTKGIFICFLAFFYNDNNSHDS